MRPLMQPGDRAGYSACLAATGSIIFPSRRLTGIRPSTEYRQQE